MGINITRNGYIVDGVYLLTELTKKQIANRIVKIHELEFTHSLLKVENTKERARDLQD